MAAVVDRIPVARHTQDAMGSDPARAAKALFKTRIEDGYEGLSVAILDSETAAPDLWSVRERSKERDTMTIQQRCSISFSFHPAIVEGTNDPLQVPRTLQLPVANTLFLNGKTSTMFAQRWLVHAGTAKGRDSNEREISCVRETSLPQQTLQMSFSNSSQTSSFDNTFQSRLLPITPPRIVSAAVGNIIRKFRVDGGSTSSTPASNELEDAIHKIHADMQQGKLQAQDTDVWALLKPQNLAGIYFDTVQDAIFNGCRLHKVLSGGGGWGEKQGLLSIDPDSDYRSNILEVQSSEPRNTEAESGQIFEEIVKPGDTVRFFINKAAPLSKAAEIAGDPPKQVRSVDRLSQRLLEFGCLPSTMDTMPAATTDEAVDHESYILLRSYFGMLSEQGMSLESTLYLPTSSNTVKPGVSTTSTGNSDVNKVVVKTKLDAPYSLVSIRPHRKESEQHEASLDSAANSKDDVDDQPSPPLRLIPDFTTPGRLEDIPEIENTWSPADKQKDQPLEVRRFLAIDKAAEKAKRASLAEDRRSLSRSQVSSKQRLDRSVRRQTLEEVVGKRRLDSAIAIMNGVNWNNRNRRLYDLGESFEKPYQDPNPVAENEHGREGMIRHRSRRRRVKVSYQRNTNGSEKQTTQPVGTSLVRKYGVADSSPRDKARKFTIRKHKSFDQSAVATTREIPETESARSKETGFHSAFHPTLDDVGTDDPSSP